MPAYKVSELSIASAMNDTDELYIIHNSLDAQITGAALKNSIIGPGAITVASGKTLTVSDTLTLTSTDGSTLAIGAGGTLGSAAYTSSSAYHVAAIAAGEITPAMLQDASAQYHILVSGATPFAYAESGFLLDGTTGGKLLLSVTSGKQLNLIATDNFSLTFPASVASGNIALGAGTLSSSSTNDVAGSTHTHAITKAVDLLGNASAQYHIPVSGVTPFTYAESGYMLDGTSGGKTSLAVTSGKTLTLTATNDFNLTVPATGTAALGAGTLTISTTNDVTVATHTHAITTSSNVGAGTAAILCSTAAGKLTLGALEIGGNILGVINDTGFISQLDNGGVSRALFYLNASNDLVVGGTGITKVFTALTLQVNGNIDHYGSNVGFFAKGAAPQPTKAGHNNWANISDVTAALAALGLIDVA